MIGRQAESYVVGAGVLAAMRGQADQPRGHETYIGERWSLTPGERFAYLYSQESDQVYLLTAAGSPRLTAPVRRFDEPSPSAVGRFGAPPRGIVLHGTRSGRRWSRQEEFESTRRYATNPAHGLAWHATGGDDAYAVHLAPSQWGWHAREHSREYLGYEFAQATVDDSISDAQVRAFVAWLVEVVWPVWPTFDPSAPAALVAHAELPAGRVDGKTDPYPNGDRRTDLLRQRIGAALRRG